MAAPQQRPPSEEQPIHESTFVRRRRTHPMTKEPKEAQTVKESSHGPIRLCYIAPIREPWKHDRYLIADVTDSIPNPPKKIKATNALLLDATDAIADGAGIRYEMEEKKRGMYIFRKDGVEIAQRRPRTLSCRHRIVQFLESNKPILHIKHGQMWRKFAQGGAQYKWEEWPGSGTLGKLRRYDSRGKTVVGETYQPSKWSGRILIFDEREVDELAILYAAYLMDGFCRRNSYATAGSVFIPGHAES